MPSVVCPRCQKQVELGLAKGRVLCAGCGGWVTLPVAEEVLDAELLPPRVPPILPPPPPQGAIPGGVIAADRADSSSSGGLGDALLGFGLRKLLRYAVILLLAALALPMFGMIMIVMQLADGLPSWEERPPLQLTAAQLKTAPFRNNLEIEVRAFQLQLDRQVDDAGFLDKTKWKKAFVPVTVTADKNERLVLILETEEATNVNKIRAVANTEPLFGTLVKGTQHLSIGDHFILGVAFPNDKIDDCWFLLHNRKPTTALFAYFRLFGGLALILVGVVGWYYAYKLYRAWQNAPPARA